MTEKTINKKAQEESLIQLQDLWKMAVRKWRWFALSIFLSLSIAVLYIAKSTPIYMRSASLLIKEDSKNVGGDNTTFSNIDIFKTSTNINNEMLTLQSPALMAEVVKKLGLNINYSIRDGLRYKTLYQQTPFSVIFTDQNSELPASFSVEVINNKLNLHDFSSAGKSIQSSTIVGDLSSPIETPFGAIIITPTEHLSKYENGTVIHVQREALQPIVAHYTQALSVTLGNDDATIVNLSIKDVSTARAEDILNTLITTYNENWIKDKNQVAVSTSDFIDRRLDVIENELGNVDDNISEYKSKNLLPDVQAATSMYLAQSSANNDRILVLNNQLSVAQFIKKHINDPASKDQLIPANLGLSSLNIESLLSDYNAMLLKRNSLLSNSSEKNPLLVELNKSIESVRQSIVQSIDNLVASLSLQISNIRQSDLQTNRQIASNPNQAKYLLSVERQQKVKESLYLYLLQKREENQLSQAFTAYNTRIINPPSGNMTPVSPQKSKILIIAFAIGFIVPTIIIFLLTNLDISVRGRKDLRHMSVPFIGEIPLFIDPNNKNRWITSLFRKKKRKRKEDPLKIVVEARNRNHINEAFRVMRTNLDFVKGNSSQEKVIMLTSFNSNSGKTFIIMNLGISQALTGKKVVVLDLDMRKGGVSANVEKVESGISNYLSGFVDNPDEIIVKGVLDPNLDIIPVGTIPPNPTELLLSERLSELLNYLRTKYDYILIDCTPIDLVADPTIVEKQADITVFVIRTGLLDRRMLPELEDMYQNKRFKNMVMALNASAHTHDKYGYYHDGYHQN